MSLSDIHGLLDSGDVLDGEEPSRVRAYAALGDSFTAGTGTPPGRCWADLLAERLRSRASDLVYRNLATQGATTRDLATQLPPAIELEPDLVTVICGANDILETVRPKPARAAARLAGALDAVRESVPGALIVTATVPERWRFLDLRPRTRERVGRGLTELNELIRALAADHRVPCLDVAGHPGLNDAENFSADGLHPSELGHARAADAFERLLRAHTADPRPGGSA